MFRRRILVALAALAVTLAARPAHPAWPHDPLTSLLIGPVGQNGGGYITPGVSDGAGGAIIFWIDGRTANYIIYAQRITADGAVAPGWPGGGLAICTASGQRSVLRAISD